jgi:hypothetical protein
MLLFMVTPSHAQPGTLDDHCARIIDPPVVLLGSFTPPVRRILDDEHIHGVFLKLKARLW